MENLAGLNACAKVPQRLLRHNLPQQQGLLTLTHARRWTSNRCWDFFEVEATPFILQSDAIFKSTNLVVVSLTPYLYKSICSDSIVHQGTFCRWRCVDLHRRDDCCGFFPLLFGSRPGTIWKLECLSLPDVACTNRQGPGTIGSPGGGRWTCLPPFRRRSYTRPSRAHASAILGYVAAAT